MQNSPNASGARRVAVYEYRDEDGAIVYRKERLEPKRFRQSRPDGRGGWINDLEGVTAVLYRLPELKMALKNGEPVYITEGEKDADRLVSIGLEATTGGATGSWRESFAEWFVDAIVYILPDNDAPGRKLAERIAADVAPVAREVRVVKLPGLPDKGDVSDYLDAGHDLADLIAEVGNAPAWKAEQATKAGASVRVLSGTLASEIAPEHVAWIWPSRLPARRLTLMGGKPGEGKSAVTMDLIARLSTASPLPDGYRPSSPVTCAILSAEDDPNDTLVPRLIAARADLQRVHVLGAVYDDLGIGRPWTLPDDVGPLEEYVTRHGIGLVVIDPLTAFLSTTVDSHRDSAVRGMLLPLAAMAKTTGCGILGVRHLRKGSSGDPRDAGSGSLAFTAAARMEWVIGRDPQDGSRRIIATTKVNIAADPPSLAYRLVSAQGEWETVAIRWDGTSTVTASQLTADAPTEDERSDLDLAVQFLGELLADGPVRSKEAIRDADDAGIAKRTLERAKGRLGVESHKRGSWWEWSMPATQDRQGSESGDVGGLGGLDSAEQNPRSQCVFNDDFIGVGVQDRQERQAPVLAMFDEPQSMLDVFGGVA